VVIALDPAEEHAYILEDDRNLKPKERTEFLFRVPTVREMEELLQMTVEQDGSEPDGFRFTAASLRFLVGWRNFRNAKGKALEFAASEDGGPSDEALGLIPWRYRQELATAVVRLGHLDEPERD